MRKAGLDESPVGIKIAGRKINKLRYADGTTLMAESEEELKSLLMWVKEESAKVGLKLNIKKTKIMTSGPLTSWQIDGEEIEVVTDFIFLGSKITADGDCGQESKRHLLLAGEAMANLNSILKSIDSTLPTKLHIVKAMVLPVAMYGCEIWTIRKAECQKIEAFELCCWRRLLQVPWTARQSNRSVPEEINPDCSLEGQIVKMKLKYFVHLMRRKDSLEKTLMLGTIEGKRREWQRMRWLDGVTEAVEGHRFDPSIFRYGEKICCLEPSRAIAGCLSNTRLDDQLTQDLGMIQTERLQKVSSSLMTSGNPKWYIRITRSPSVPFYPHKNNQREKYQLGFVIPSDPDFGTIFRNFCMLDGIVLVFESQNRVAASLLCYMGNDDRLNEENMSKTEKRNTGARFSGQKTCMMVKTPRLKAEKHSQIRFAYNSDGEPMACVLQWPRRALSDCIRARSPQHRPSSRASDNSAHRGHAHARKGVAVPGHDVTCRDSLAATRPSFRMAVMYGTSSPCFSSSPVMYGTSLDTNTRTSALQNRAIVSYSYECSFWQDQSSEMTINSARKDKGNFMYNLLTAQTNKYRFYSHYVADSSFPRSKEHGDGKGWRWSRGQLPLELSLCVTYSTDKALDMLNWCLAVKMDWMRANKLNFNPDKTEMLLVERRISVWVFKDRLDVHMVGMSFKTQIAVMEYACVKSSMLLKDYQSKLNDLSSCIKGMSHNLWIEDNDDDNDHMVVRIHRKQRNENQINCEKRDLDRTIMRRRVKASSVLPQCYVPNMNQCPCTYCGGGDDDDDGDDDDGGEEVTRTQADKGFIGHHQHLELGPDFNGKPVKLTEDWSHVNRTPSPRQQPGSSILNQLKYPDRLQGQPHVERFTEVKSGSHQRVCHCRQAVVLQAAVQHSHCLTWIGGKREIELGIISVLMVPQPSPPDDLSQRFHVIVQGDQGRFSTVPGSEAGLKWVQIISFIQECLELSRHHPLQHLGQKRDVGHWSVNSLCSKIFHKIAPSEDVPCSFLQTQEKKNQDRLSPKLTAQVIAWLPREAQFSHTCSIHLSSPHIQQCLEATLPSFTVLAYGLQQPPPELSAAALRPVPLPTSFLDQIGIELWTFLHENYNITKGYASWNRKNHTSYLSKIRKPTSPKHIMRKAGLAESEVGIKIARRNINNLRYADDTTLMAVSEKELKSLLMQLKEKSAKAGLKLNIKKTKIMASGSITSWQIDGEEMEVVTDFNFLGSKITADRDCNQEIKRHLLLGRKAMANLDSILKSRDSTLPTLCVIKAMVFPVAIQKDIRWQAEVEIQMKDPSFPHSGTHNSVLTIAVPFLQEGEYPEEGFLCGGTPSMECAPQRDDDDEEEEEEEEEDYYYYYYYYFQLSQSRAQLFATSWTTFLKVLLSSAIPQSTIKGVLGYGRRRVRNGVFITTPQNMPGQEIGRIPFGDETLPTDLWDTEFDPVHTFLTRHRLRLNMQSPYFPELAIGRHKDEHHQLILKKEPYQKLYKVRKTVEMGKLITPLPPTPVLQDRGKGAELRKGEFLPGTPTTNFT
ncbi:putative uncharacterized transposon-derived protein F52C9.6 [Varanus komodoensis]|nr:putative uncharacterized transposon-derived protein F52C9.6 [Varanus komodoensis]